METTTPNKYAGFGAAIAAELMIRFWFGIGVISTVGIVDSLNYCIEALMSSNFESILWRWGHCSHWGIRRPWL